MTDSGNTTTPPDWAGALVEQLERQQSIVDELSSLAERQADLIETRKTEPLLSLLARRQELIDNFRGAQATLADLTGHVESDLDAIEPARRAHIQSLMAHIGDRLAVVMEGDARDQRQLEMSRDETSRELASLGTARQANAAYRPPSISSNNRFADERG